MQNALAFLFFLSGFFLTGCQTPGTSFQFYRFGTVISGKIYHADTQTAEAAIAFLNQRLQELEIRWHPWHPDSELAALSAACRQGEIYSPSPDSQGLLATGQALQDASLGYFNPEIGALVGLWGFHAGALPENLPKAEALAAWRENFRPGRHYDFSQAAESFTCQRSIQFDFSAFAKGYALDLLAKEIKNKGITLALLNAGGDIKTLGQPGRPWSIGIRTPRGSSVHAGVTLYANESIATSGDYERYFFVEGQRYHHLLDPNTAEPANYFQAVTVIADSAGLADAASTALFVAQEHWPAVAKSLGLTLWVLYRQDGEVVVSPAMQQRLRWQLRPEK